MAWAYAADSAQTTHAGYRGSHVVCEAWLSRIRMINYKFTFTFIQCGSNGITRVIEPAAIIMDYPDEC